MHDKIIHYKEKTIFAKLLPEIVNRKVHSIALKKDRNSAFIKYEYITGQHITFSGKDIQINQWN